MTSSIKQTSLSFDLNQSTLDPPSQNLPRPFMKLMPRFLKSRTDPSSPPVSKSLTLSRLILNPNPLLHSYPLSLIKQETCFQISLSEITARLMGSQTQTIGYVPIYLSWILTRSDSNHHHQSGSKLSLLHPHPLSPSLSLPSSRQSRIIQ